MISNFKSENNWKEFFQEEMSKNYFCELDSFLEKRRKTEVNIYPSEENIFKAFQITDLDKIRIIIIGQDPYPTPDVAHGLSFSVTKQTRIPASLKNIYDELDRDLDITPASHGYLENWAKQGVLLLNAVLTVEEKSPNSHQGKGWETFTKAVIEKLNKDCSDIVVLAWGKYAHTLCESIDETKHKVIYTSHPSNMGGACKRPGRLKDGREYDAFVGSSCFSKANEYLKSKGKTPIDWEIE